MLHIYYCWCVDDHYLSPYQTRANWLPWLLRKAGPLYFNIGPWGPYTSKYVAYLLLLACGWSIPITIPNQSQVAALVLRKSRPLILTYMGPWGPHTSAYGVYLPLWVYGSSILITIPNQSQVAALVAKKKQALCIFYMGPWGPWPSFVGPKW